MATSLSNVSNIANIIVGSGSDSESSDDENDDCESLVSDLNNNSYSATVIAGIIPGIMHEFRSIMQFKKKKF